VARVEVTSFANRLGLGEFRMRVARAHSHDRSRPMQSAQRRVKRRFSHQPRGGGAGGLIDREARCGLTATFKRPCPRISFPAIFGKTPVVGGAHWLAHPAAVRHCGMDPQSGMVLWHGQSPAFSAVMLMVIVHALAIAMLATGANAIAREITNATMVRDHVIEWGS